MSHHAQESLSQNQSRSRSQSQNPRTSSLSPLSNSNSSRRRDVRTPEPVEEESEKEKRGRLHLLRKRVRRSGGGFLLDPTLPRGRQGGGGVDDGVKSPRKSREEAGSLHFRTNGRKSEDGNSNANSISSGKTREDSDDAFLHVNGGTAKPPSSRWSNESSIRSSPLSREIDDGMRMSMDGALSDSRPLSSNYEDSPSSRPISSNYEHSSSQQQPIIDPAQLVQMALSLSEGRRRHASTALTLPLPPISADNRRVRSAGGPVVQVTSSPMANDSLRRPSSARASLSPYHNPRPSTQSTQSSQHSAGHLNLPQDPADFDDIQEEEEDFNFQFSTATINRAERAKRFFDLATQYRRLLNHLPPLKPDSSAPANYTFSTPGGVYTQVNRIRSNTLSKHDLGREYNPLQLLRNRRIRHREQRPFDPQPDVFDNVDRVKSYIDEVETYAKGPAYRGPADTVTLPTFPSAAVSDELPPTLPPRPHKRTDTATSKTSRPIGDWSFTPSELFADALWLEQTDNKTLIENRRGHKLFPNYSRPSLDDVKKSKESLERVTTNESANGTADEGPGKRGRKARKLLSLRKVDNAARKHIFRQRDRSASSSDDSSRRRPYKHGHGHAYSDDNIAPLDRHMRQLIEEEQSASAELISPDKWYDSQPLNVEEEDPSTATKPNHTRTTSSYSFDEDTAPNSPNLNNFIPAFGMSLSPPETRPSSPERRPLFSKRNSEESQKIQTTDFAASRSSLFKPKKTNGEDTPKRSFESIRPNMLKRHKTTATVQPRQNQTDTAVGRFFKGGRLGNLVRAEGSNFGWKKKPPKDTQPTSDTSDNDSATDEDFDDDDYGRVRKPSPGALSRANTTGGDKPKYHTAGLPTFKSHNSQDSDVRGDGDGDGDGSISYQHDKSRDSQTRLAPPIIQLPDEDLNDDPQRNQSTVSTVTDERSPNFLTPNKSRSAESSVWELGLPGTAHMNKRPMTGLANTTATPERRPSLAGKRQWSISDAGRARQKQEMQKVTARDIAQVRALFLSSGVKAHQLVKRAYAVIEPPSDFYTSAAKTAGEKPDPVQMREEYLIAARLLSRTITSTTEALRSDLDRSRSERIPALHARFEELKHQVDEKLMPLIQSTADEADAFTVEITTHQTLAVKQVNDAVDNILRSRRRRFRLLRKAGFGVLEWFVLGLLWVVWFVVVLVRFARRVVGGAVWGVRWCLWL
ncbi:hypothetical protein BDV97DRAFT_364771 [Delphinella strobiligena]|nr:hypothetical protein BDV97DRAFT_364771 [Delphinella strobiligena]